MLYMLKNWLKNYDIEAGQLSTKKYQLYVNIGVNSNLFVLFDDGSDLWMVNEGS